jgi:uncharacterized protein (UPF0548 family)
MQKMVRALESAQPTYIDLGATLAGVRPEGFHHDRYETPLGHGPENFERAVQGLRSWQAHRVAGVQVFPEGQTIEIGATILVTLGTPLVALAAPCRIVGVVDEVARWGFAYGTLPGHPEEGEEAFIVSISPDHVVKFEIVAFSRPGVSLVRMAGPMGRVVQKGATKGYLRSLRRYVEVNQ